MYIYSNHGFLMLIQVSEALIIYQNKWEYLALSLSTLYTYVYIYVKICILCIFKQLSFGKAPIINSSMEVHLHIPRSPGIPYNLHWIINPYLKLSWIPQVEEVCVQSTCTCDWTVSSQCWLEREQHRIQATWEPVWLVPVGCGSRQAHSSPGGCARSVMPYLGRKSDSRWKIHSRN